MRSFSHCVFPSLLAQLMLIPQHSAKVLPPQGDFWASQLSHTLLTKFPHHTSVKGYAYLLGHALTFLSLVGQSLDTLVL